ncbi:MAG: ATP-binding cassette domain-containing protein [Lachnospiraceae bacterium]|nr:ATP-binding cassette domain-containing protein [Lachnospiraceae bacterium]
MRIHHICVKNKAVCISNIYIDLTQPGVYQLTGENGTGKTSLIESIVFEDNDAVFDDPNEEILYREERERLFAYVPQDIVSYNVSVWEYMRKGSKIKPEKIETLCRQTGLYQQIDFKKSFHSLSGGEKVKVALITALLKDTPYLFLDEPTNNLDDEGVRWFVDTIKRSHNKKIVIASHDPRISALVNVQLDIAKLPKDAEKHMGAIKSEQKLSKTGKQAVRGLVLTRSAFLYAALALVYVLILGWTFSELYSYFFSKESLMDPDIIVVYCADDEYGALNQTYVEWKHLSIDENKYETMMPLASLSRLSSSDLIKEIYIRDVSYYDCYLRLESDELVEQALIFSIPEIIQKDERLINQMSADEFTYLKSGRLPKDNAKEIVVSAELLARNYGMSNEDAENAIGETISLLGTDYEIVGIGLCSVYLVSYEKGCNYGIYYFDQRDFEEFYGKQKKAFEKTLYENTMLESLLIVTRENCEERLLRELITEYPASNYISRDFILTYRKSINQKFYKISGGLGLAMSLLYGISLYLIFSGYIKQSRNRVCDLSNYYASKKIISWYYGGYFALNAGLLLVMAAILGIMNQRFHMDKSILLYEGIFCILMLIPSLLGLWVQKRKAFERYSGDC